jgi:hypothetical protein
MTDHAAAAAVVVVVCVCACVRVSAGVDGIAVGGVWTVSIAAGGLLVVWTYVLE